MAPWQLSRQFLGCRPSVTEARRFVTTFLLGWPIVEQAELIVSELATNAIRHSDSGRFGGRFTVRIAAEPTRVRVSVADEGGRGCPAVSTPLDDAESGRGLFLVASMAQSWGVEGGEYGRVIWASLTIDPPATRLESVWPGAGAAHS